MVVLGCVVLIGRDTVLLETGLLLGVGHERVPVC